MKTITTLSKAKKHGIDTCRSFGSYWPAEIEWPLMEHQRFDHYNRPD